MMFGSNFPGIKLIKSELRLDGVVILMERSFFESSKIIFHTLREEKLSEKRFLKRVRTESGN